MRFQVERDALADAVAWVSRALPARPVIPVLSGLLLNAADGLTLSCFDYEVSARVRVDAKVVEPGTVLVPGRLLAEITRSLPSLPAEFGDDPDGVSLTCGSAAFTLVTLPVEEYPDLPGLQQAAGTVDGGALAAAISQVAPAASRDDTLPLLTGVNVEVDGGTMTLAATDRYRLAVRELPWNPARPGMSGAFLVPARTLADAARTMAAGVPVTIKLQSGPPGTGEVSGGPVPGGDGGNEPAAAGGGAGGAAPAARASGTGRADAMIGFESGGRRLTTRLIAGDFIKYRSRFPADSGCRADMPAGPFAEAVRRVSLVAERGSAIRLAFGSGAVTIEAGTQGRARARETVQAEFAGTEPDIAFSPHFLLDGITAAAVATAEPAADDEAAGVHGGPPDREGVAALADAGKRGANNAEQGGGDADAERRGHADAADRTSAYIRLEFSSATKPAVITGVRLSPPVVERPVGAGPKQVAGHGRAGTARREPTGRAEPDHGAGSGAPDFRYLVVPLRAPARD
jgi:DNA polymerase-3 subunit beta